MKECRKSAERVEEECSSGSGGSIFNDAGEAEIVSQNNVRSEGPMRSVFFTTKPDKLK